MEGYGRVLREGMPVEVRRKWAGREEPMARLWCQDPESKVGGVSKSTFVPTRQQHIEISSEIIVTVKEHRRLVMMQLVLISWSWHSGIQAFRARIVASWDPNLLCPSYRVVAM